MHSFSKVTAAAAFAAAMLLGAPAAFAADQNHTTPNEEISYYGSFAQSSPGLSNTFADLSAFYDVPQNLPREKGKVVKTLPDSVKYGQATGTPIMYTTENSSGQTVAATAVALKSNAQWKGQGERPLIVLAPGTQGLGDHCAPSSQLENGTATTLVELTALLNQGYNVTVIDYIGGGTEGTLSYLNRLDQGHAVLDAARASTGGSVDFVSANAPVGVWGYSQGGGAAASAGELHASYAPDVNLKGVFAGAVPADLQSVIGQIDGTIYNGFALMGLAGLGDSLGLDLSQYLSATGMQMAEDARHVCTFDAISRFGSVRDTSSWTLSGQTLKQMSVENPTIAGVLKEHSLGQQGRHPDVPILIASSYADDVIPHQSNRDLAASYCRAGAPRVSFYTSVTPTHAGGALGVMPSGLIFMNQVFTGAQTSNDCGMVGA